MLTPVFSPNVGGVETHLDDLCNLLSDNGYKVYVITYQPLMTGVRAKGVERKGNLEIRRISWFGRNWFYKLEQYPLLEFLYLFPGLFVYSFLFLLGNVKKIDVIHAHGFVAAGVTMILATVFSKRSILSTHTVYGSLPQSAMAPFFKRILNSFDVILCLSCKSKEELIDLGIDSKKIDVYTYWVDQAIFKPRDRHECREKLGWEEKFVVLFVGRLIEEKGVKILSKVSEMLSCYERMQFVFIGDGPLAGELSRISERTGNIVFLGKVKNEELSLYYNAADVVLVPSLGREGFPRVILEALSCGTPVIGTRRGSIPEAVNASVGFLTEPEAREIASAILHLVNLSKHSEELRQKCREYAQDRFSNRNLEVILRAYEDYDLQPDIC
jgi:glycosyltransferase involved in cell wall biosynthesis